MPPQSPKFDFSPIFPPVIIILFFFLTLFLYTRLAGPLPFNITSTTTQKTDSFSVTGLGKASIKPDSATVRVGVNAKGATATDAKDKINLNINKVTAAIKALGIAEKDIQTENFNVNESYDPSTKGFEGNTNITVKVNDPNLANKVLDTAVANGATNIGGVQFDTKDKQTAENTAREMAVKEAKSKAEIAAKAAGFKLGKIINYSENSGGYGGITPMMAKADSANRETTQIEPGENEVNFSVTLSYEVL